MAFDGFFAYRSTNFLFILPFFLFGILFFCSCLFFLRLSTNSTITGISVINFSTSFLINFQNKKKRNRLPERLAKSFGTSSLQGWMDGSGRLNYALYLWCSERAPLSNLNKCVWFSCLPHLKVFGFKYIHTYSDYNYNKDK